MVHRPHEKRVPIGGRLGRNARAQGAASATAVVNHQLFARHLGKLGGKRARKGVGTPASGKRHHHIQGLGWPARLGVYTQVGTGQGASAPLQPLAA